MGKNKKIVFHAVIRKCCIFSNFPAKVKKLQFVCTKENEKKSYFHLNHANTELLEETGESIGKLPHQGLKMGSQFLNFSKLSFQLPYDLYSTCALKNISPNSNKNTNKLFTHPIFVSDLIHVVYIDFLTHLLHVGILMLSLLVVKLIRLFHLHVVEFV